jgi:hypothetical protein
MSAAIRALLDGLWTVVRAPLVLMLLVFVTVATAVPFALVVGDRLRTALGNQPPINLDATEIDAEWWMEFRAHAQGLEATFTPAVIGFAAPLDNLSALVDAAPRPLAILLPVAIYALVWCFLLGGLIERFSRRTGISARDFLQAGRRHLPTVLALTTLALLSSLVLYATIHPWLFGPVYEWLASRLPTERDAFVGRLSLYAIFVGLLAVVSAVADYARIGVVMSSGAVGFRGGLTSGVRFVRAHWPAVCTLAVLSGGLFVALLVLYGVADRRLGGWRGVILGQAYIVARLGLRATVLAAQVRLVQQARAGSQVA